MPRGRCGYQTSLQGNPLTFQLSLPFCQPFGNRRLLHCIPAGADEGTAGEVPAWEACGKVLKKEKRDFYEFIVRPQLCTRRMLADRRDRWPTSSSSPSAS